MTTLEITPKVIKALKTMRNSDLLLKLLKQFIKQNGTRK